MAPDLCYDAHKKNRKNANKKGGRKMRVDVARLRGKIAECGTTQEKLARAIGMDKSTFSRKMKSEALEFSIGDMHMIAEALRLSKVEAGEIFLS